MARPKNKPVNHLKKWTTEEEDFLLDNYGTLSMYGLMKHLGRNKEAIERKHQKLTGTISSHIAGGLYSPPEIAEALGVSRRTILNWIKLYGLPATQKTIVHDRRGKKQLRHSIDPNTFWRWARQNMDRIKFEHVQEGAILPEPQWAKDTMKQAKNQHVYKAPTWWSDLEKQKAWDLYLLGDDYESISKEINRPVEGVREMINKLKRIKREEAMSKIG